MVSKDIGVYNHRGELDTSDKDLGLTALPGVSFWVTKMTLFWDLDIEIWLQMVHYQLFLLELVCKWNPWCKQMIVKRDVAVFFLLGIHKQLLVKQYEAADCTTWCKSLGNAEHDGKILDTFLDGRHFSSKESTSLGREHKCDIASVFSVIHFCWINHVKPSNISKGTLNCVKEFVKDVFLAWHMFDNCSGNKRSNSDMFNDFVALTGGGLEAGNIWKLGEGRSKN